MEDLVDQVIQKLTTDTRQLPDFIRVGKARVFYGLDKPHLLSNKRYDGRYILEPNVIEYITH